MKKRLLLAALFCAVTGSVVAAEPRARVLAAAENVLKNLRETAYDHTPEVDEKAGRYRLDCSGLAAYLLRSAASWSLAAVPVGRGKSRPRAVDFTAIFACARNTPVPGWEAVPRVVDALPGDFIAWRREVLPEKGNTGHIVMILEKPVRESDGTVRVRIFDATTGPHGDDTRPEGTTGVGVGTMWFRVDARGRPVAYHWSTRHYKPRTEPIALGRAVEADLAGRDPAVGRAVLMKARKDQVGLLGADGCCLDPTYPDLPADLRAGDKLRVRRHDGEGEAVFTVRFDTGNLNGWSGIRLAAAGRKRLGYADPDGEILTFRKAE